MPRLRHLLTALTVLTVGLVLPAGSAVAAPELGISSITFRGEVAVVRAVCPVDPPTTLLVFGDVAGDGVEGVGVLGQTSIDCTRRQQRFVVPVSGLVPGQTVTEVSVTISGDSGEINASFPDRVVRR